MQADILLKTLTSSGFKNINVAVNTASFVICIFVWAGFDICRIVVALFHA